jgi:hypothetical protein
VSEKPETKLARACMKWVKSQGGNSFHVHGSSMQRAGEPDIDGAIAWGDGTYTHFKIELKIKPNVADALQLARLQDWADQGYTTGVAYTLAEFQLLIINGKRLR